ncbi:MAG: hypothetical protein KME13_05645 [Myxacorys californica WJT36-NPBG1]|jgi:hypothetical protein|nr:hypothetical protein [Myxacorys californica WJT36-NPBG1]
MTRPTRNSKPLEKAELRAKNLQSIDPNFDLGNGLSLAAYTVDLTSLREKLDTYNDMIETLDRIGQEIQLAEESINDFSEHILLGVAARYGKGSNEYAIAGGARKNSRRQTIRNTTARLAPQIAEETPSTQSVTQSMLQDMMVAPVSTNGKNGKH